MWNRWLAGQKIVVETPSETSRRYLLNKLKGIEVLENENEEVSDEQYNYFENDDNDMNDVTTSRMNEFVNDLQNECCSDHVDYWYQ